MTEAGVVEIIKVLGALFGVGFGVINTWLITRTMIQVRDNTALTQETKAAMVGLEEHTNSIKDALVKVTGEKEFARGLQIGTEGWGKVIKGLGERTEGQAAERIATATEKIAEAAVTKDKK